MKNYPEATGWLGPLNTSRCPKCKNSLQNGIPDGSPDLRRCATCGTIFKVHPKEIEWNNMTPREKTIHQLSFSINTRAIKTAQRARGLRRDSDLAARECGLGVKDIQELLEEELAKEESLTKTLKQQLNLFLEGNEDSIGIYPMDGFDCYDLMKNMITDFINFAETNAQKEAP